MAINLQYSPPAAGARGMTPETEAERRRRELLARMGGTRGTAPVAGGRDVGWPYGVQPERGGVMGRYSTVEAATRAVGKSPLTGEEAFKPRAETDWREFGTAEQFERLEVPPEGLEEMPTGLSAWLQMRSQAAADKAAAEQAQKAVSTLEQEPTGAAAAPDVEGVLSQAERSQKYWEREKRQKRAEAAERFRFAKERLEQQRAQGAPADWINRQEWQLSNELRKAEATADVEVERRREEYDARLAEAEANALLSRYATAGPLAERRTEALAGAQAAVPTAAVTPWTLYEQYGRGARMEQEAADMQRLQALKAAAGVGGGGMALGGAGAGGAPLGPVEGDTSGAGGFGGGVVEYPHGYGSYGEYQQALRKKGAAASAEKTAAAEWAMKEFPGVTKVSELDASQRLRAKWNAPKQFKKYFK